MSKLLGHVLTQQNQHRSEALTWEFSKIWDRLALCPAHLYIAYGATEPLEKKNHTLRNCIMNPNGSLSPALKDFPESNLALSFHLTQMSILMEKD